MSERMPTNHQVLPEECLREIVITRLQSMFLDRPLRENSEIIYKVIKRLNRNREVRLDQFFDKVVAEFDREKREKAVSVYPHV